MTIFSVLPMIPTFGSLSNFFVKEKSSTIKDSAKAFESLRIIWIPKTSMRLIRNLTIRTVEENDLIDKTNYPIAKNIPERILLSGMFVHETDYIFLSLRIFIDRAGV